MSEEPITSQRHNEFVGSDANAGRIPGADKAITGHHCISVFPKEGAPKQSNVERRVGEHLPPPTGRDWPPRGVSPDAANRWGERLTTVRNSGTLSQEQEPLPPVPDSQTVIDSDPWAEPTTTGDTLGGPTSQDLYRGIGVPAQGMSSAEMRHEGKSHRKRSLQGLSQYGNGRELFGKEDANDLSDR